MKILLPILFASTFLFGDVAKSVPYDADLFKRDTPAFSVHGSFLFWRVQEGALDYALTMKSPAPSGISYAQGDYKKATFDGEPGFRIALSYFRAPKYWEMWTQYTRLSAAGSDSASKPVGVEEYLSGTWPQTGSNPLTQATNRIQMKYNTFEFLVNRMFIPNPHLRLRFLGGATVAWMDQNWRVRYFDNGLDVLSQIRNSWDFVGGGFRFGTMVDWYCGYDLYLTAASTFATVLGSYHNRAKQTDRELSALIRDARYHDVRSLFSVQALFGLSWQKNFCSSRMEIFGGYELNTWFNLHEIYRDEGGQPHGARQGWINTSAIALQGLTTRMTLDF